MDSVGDLIAAHQLKRAAFAAAMHWSPVTASRKLRNKRPWTYDEIDRAARWFRLHGVPVGPPDLRILVRVGT
jgi:hypothetical protein